MTNPNLSEALEEAYASADPDQVITDTVSIYYDGLVDDDGNPSDLYLFNGNNPTSVSTDGIATLMAKIEVSAPRKAGQTVTFLGIPFQITMPDMTTDQQARAALNIDSINQEMIDLLIAASQSGKGIEVTYRSYIVDSELDGPENDPPIVFHLVDVNAPTAHVSGNLVVLTIGGRRFPWETYTPSRFKTLQYG